MKIAQRTFLVTGASSGLGAATAKRLIELGANVVLADVDVARGEANARQLGAKARFVPVDVTRTDEVRAAVEVAEREFAGLHGLIHAAGIVYAARVLGREGPHDLQAFARLVEVNLVGTFNVTRLAAEAIAKTEPGPDGERGVIVHTSSVAAFDGQIGQAAYSASKGGVAAMTLPLARELAKDGIRVVTIAPGVFDTPMVQSMPTEVREGLAAQVPFPARLGRPEEYALLVEQIVLNPMLNGSVIRLDGAIRMGTSPTRA